MPSDRKRMLLKLWNDAVYWHRAFESMAKSNPKDEHVKFLEGAAHATAILWEDVTERAWGPLAATADKLSYAVAPGDTGHGD